MLILPLALTLRLVEMQTVRDAIGQVITRDVDPPTFAILGVRFSAWPH